MTVLVSADPLAVSALSGVLAPSTTLPRAAELRRHLEVEPDDLVVLGPDVDLGEATGFAAAERIARPTLGVVLVRQRVDTPVLTAAVRAGVREVVAAHDLQRLRQACDASRALSAEMQRAAGVEQHAPVADGRLVTVLGGKGGVGTTTLAVSTAVSLARSGLRTCLVDLDLAFGDVAMALRLLPERTLGDAIGMGSTLDAAGASSLTVRHRSGLAVLLAPTTPSAAERIPGDLVGRLLEVLVGLHDVVVVDTPSAFTDPVLAALDAVDDLLLVTTPDVAAVKNHKLVEQTLDQLALPRERRRVVLNRAGSDSGLSPADLQAMLGGAPAATVPVSAALAVAANRGVALVEEAPRDPAARAIAALAGTLAPIPARTPAPAPSSGGLGLFRRRAVAP